MTYVRSGFFAFFSSLLFLLICFSKNLSTPLYYTFSFKYFQCGRFCHSLFITHFFFSASHTQKERVREKSACTSERREKKKKKTRRKIAPQPNHADWGKQKESFLNCPCFTYKSGHAYLHTLGHIIFDALLQCADMRSNINRNAFHIHTFRGATETVTKNSGRKGEFVPHFE